MLVIEHRVNDISSPALSECGEIDVHLEKDGQFDVKHDVRDPGCILSYFLQKTSHERFFVDVKQNLHIECYQKLVNIFGDRLIGIFDVPFPSSYYAEKNGIPVYHRLSEMERPITGWNKYWLDPLTDWSMRNYKALMVSTNSRDDIIVCCPSLHGQDLETCEKIWNWMLLHNMMRTCNIRGIVTKHTESFMEFLNEKTS